MKVLEQIVKVQRYSDLNFQNTSGSGWHVFQVKLAELSDAWDIPREHWFQERVRCTWWGHENTSAVQFHQWSVAALSWAGSEPQLHKSECRAYELVLDIHWNKVHLIFKRAAPSFKMAIGIGTTVFYIWSKCSILHLIQLLHAFSAWDYPLNTPTEIPNRKLVSSVKDCRASQKCYYTWIYHSKECSSVKRNKNQKP